MTIITKLAVASMMLMTFSSMARTVELDDKALEGAAYITYYSKRCVKFESLPLKTQQGITQLNAVYGRVIMTKMIDIEESMRKQFSNSTICNMIQRSFPGLLD